MTRPPHLRSGLISAALVVLAVAAWLLLAPTQIGGETSYVTTSGIEHAAALPQRRPRDGPTRGPVPGRATSSPTAASCCTSSSCTASSRSRAIASSLKGDNNDFTDPDAPRARRRGRQAVGPRRRTAAASCTGCTRPSWPRCCAAAWPLLLFMGAKRQRRRRDRRRPPEERGTRPLEPLPPAATARRSTTPHEQTIFTTCAVVALVFLAPRRARLHASGDQAGQGQDSLHREGQLRLPRQGVCRAGLSRRRREHGRPDLRQARTPRARQGPLPPAGHGTASPRRHHGGRPAPLEPHRLEPHHPARRPQALHGRLRGRRRDARPARGCRSLIREVEKLTGGTGGSVLQPRDRAARAPGRDARQPAAHQRLRAGAQAPARRPASCAPPSPAPAVARRLRRRLRLGRRAKGGLNPEPRGLGCSIDDRGQRPHGPRTRPAGAPPPAGSRSSACCSASPEHCSPAPASCATRTTRPSTSSATAT